MTSCTIIVSHFESHPFLRACIRQIRKYSHPEINQHIIISEQSSEGTFNGVMNEFGGQPDITIVKTQSLYSGFGTDYILRNIKIESDYVCSLHVDAFPIHKNWLYLCIKLIEEENFVFAGQLHFFSRPTDPIYYLKNMFFSMSPTFNVARTETYLEMSMEAGFTRYHERTKIDPPMLFNNRDWEEWASSDYWKRGSDDDVIAFCWQDNHRQHNKIGLAVTGTIGLPPDPGYGRIIEDVVFHFGSSCEAKGVMEHMGESYRNFTNKINSDFSDELINELVELSVKNAPAVKTRDVWDGVAKTVSTAGAELNEKIESLKNN